MIKHRRAALALALLAFAFILLQWTEQVAAWSIARIRLPFGNIMVPPAHHEELAEKAARCLPAVRIPLPGCRRNYPVNPAFFVQEVRRGAVEPDLAPELGDGKDSSRHSLNPRFSEAMRVPISRAYGFLPESLHKGLARQMIDDVKERIKTSIGALSCASPSFEGLQLLWHDMGRLSHYVADLNSPFHPNSFAAGANPFTDYHEGVLDRNQWLKGLWDRGPDGQFRHFTLELAMGEAANISSVSCSATSGTDPEAMAESAAAVMDTYTSTAGNGSGYAGLLFDYLLTSGVIEMS